ncbi:MAG TPA: 23S rRNA (pseudouridine(1915)-N(3))-methyltransferase RlmH [Gammaproteobacteria bacterium]|nr:23S rRNA (pseudouridine(1915)-N(3))-methyltransferase RlmH [Gammaproteobacteria bacterium]
MHLHLIAVGKRMPAWVAAGFQDYARRLPSPWALRLTEIPPVNRTSGKAARDYMREEGERVQRACPEDAYLVVLDERGKDWNSKQLSQRLQRWSQDGRDVAFIIGGADGVDAALKKCADELWSLSPLTLPHALARVVVAEQIYRAWSLLSNHPYHRD